MNASEARLDPRNHVRESGLASRLLLLPRLRPFGVAQGGLSVVEGRRGGRLAGETT